MAVQERAPRQDRVPAVLVDLGRVGHASTAGAARRGVRSVATQAEVGVPQPARVAGSGSQGGLVAVTAVVVMLVLRVVFVSFPVLGLIGQAVSPTLVGGLLVVVFMVGVQVAVMRRVLTGVAPSRILQVLATAELAVALAAVFAFGPLWVAMPVFGLVDVLLCLTGRARGLAVATGVVVYVLAVARLHEPMTVVAVLAEFLLGVFVLYMLPRLVLNIRELQSARTELRALTLAQERARLARDLHDTLGQQLSVALLKLDVLERVAMDDTFCLREELGEIQAILRFSMAEMQRVVNSLRPPSIRDEITSAVALLRSAGAEVTVGVADQRLGARTSEVLAWVVREGTTNILRHSAATRCRITLDSSEREVRLSLSNDVPAPSMSPVSGGSGLPGLRERLREVDGDLRVTRTEQQFTLTAAVPTDAG